MNIKNENPTQLSLFHSWNQ